jgi:hypothetical protein
MHNANAQMPAATNGCPGTIKMFQLHDDHILKDASALLYKKYPSVFSRHGIDGTAA